MGKCHYYLWPAPYKDRHGGLSIHPPLLLCSLLQAEPVSSKNLLHVVITALQSLKKTSFSLFLPSTSSGQSVFFPRQNCSPYRHSFAEILARSGGCKASHASQAGAKLTSLKALLAGLPLAAAAAGLQMAVQWFHVTSEFKVRSIFMPPKIMNLMLLELFSPFCCVEVNPRGKLKPCRPCRPIWKGNTPFG